MKTTHALFIQPLFSVLSCNTSTTHEDQAGKPVDMLLLPDGSQAVSAYQANMSYRISHKGQRAETTPGEA